jgi:hypothetical protein
VAGITRGGWGGAGAGLVDLGLVLVACEERGCYG